jgi:haloalkane dehalogenase
MKVLRTPDARFAALPGYTFEPHYVEVPDGEGGSLRIHYVDVGPRDGAVVLLLHGEPSWSYLYRKMIPGLVAGGLRAVAPDLVGFGRSDKPTERSDYTYARHVAWVRACIEKIGLRDMTLFAQDWGSLIGLRLVAEHPDAFARVVISNGGLPTGDQQMPDAFLAWRKFSQEAESFDVGRIVARACATDPTPDVIAAYDAPFPDDTYKAGARQFPVLVPASPDDPATLANRAAWQALARFEKPFLTAFGDKDPITRGADRLMQQMIPGAKGQPHTTVAGGGHFIQEDRGEELAQILVRFVRG